MTNSSALNGQSTRMREAIAPVLQLGPDFLAGRRNAEDMATTMVTAVQGFVATEEAHLAAHGPEPVTAAAQHLQGVLGELYTCGSGYLADQCDAACVARTMQEIVTEFGDSAPPR